MQHVLLTVSLTIIILNSFIFFAPLIQTIHAQPNISDTTLDVEPAVKGLSFPTSMAFLDDNNLLVLEQEGNVRLVSNGVLQEQPLLRVPVKTHGIGGESGLLGIAIVNGTGGTDGGKADTNVFLYYTEAEPLRNRVYKYHWTGHSLVNPTLILDLPALPGPHHHGGKITIGPDGYLYAVIGDLDHFGQLQNSPDGPPPNDTSVILRVNPEDGLAAPDNPFANSLLSKYYAYGIRNSFGMDFDPLTGNLWDTENGESSYDEINLVRPGFNSGWVTVMGPISRSGRTEEQLVSFPGSNYSDPLLSWRFAVGPTDLEFFTSSKLGDKYTNNIFVGDVNRGNLYFFEVNQNRDGIKLDSAQRKSGLSDLVVDSEVEKGTSFINEEELSAITFGSGFGGITDIETGPDGFLYVLSIWDGIIYKISPSLNPVDSANVSHAQSVPPRRNVDDPFLVAFPTAGVDNDTGYIINWVTANNVTEAVINNASAVDLVEANAKDGLIEPIVSLPNGTIHIGDKFKACTMVPKYMYHVCSTGFNWLTNKPEYIYVMIPNLNETSNLNDTTNPLSAQRKETIDDTPFAVIFSTAGVDNDTGYVINWVTANNTTNVSFYNASDVDLWDDRQDGFIEPGVSLPNGTIHIGDKYKACTMVLKNNNPICNAGINLPGRIYEYNSVILP